MKTKAEQMAAHGHTNRRILVRSMRYGLRVQPALLVRGSSRRIMTLRFRPAYISEYSIVVICPPLPPARPSRSKRAGSSSVEENPARKNNQSTTRQTRDFIRNLTSRSISEQQ